MLVILFNFASERSKVVSTFGWYIVEKPLCSLKQVLLMLVMNCLDELKLSQLSLTYTTLLILWVV